MPASCRSGRAAEIGNQEQCFHGRLPPGGIVLGLGSFMMYCAASRRVSRGFRPGIVIGHRKRAASRDRSRGGGLVFLALATRHDLQRIVRQRPLQRLRLIPWRAHPDVSFFVGRQDHRHRLRVDRLHHRVRRGGQEAVDEMRAGDLRQDWTISMKSLSPTILI
jgi:hypothetical protein